MFAVYICALLCNKKFELKKRIEHMSSVSIVNIAYLFVRSQEATLHGHVEEPEESDQGWNLQQIPRRHHTSTYR